MWTLETNAMATQSDAAETGLVLPMSDSADGPLRNGPRFGPMGGWQI
jgi:hypothetical protein